MIILDTFLPPRYLAVRRQFAWSSLWPLSPGNQHYTHLHDWRVCSLWTHWSNLHLHHCRWIQEAGNTFPWTWIHWLFMCDLWPVGNGGWWIPHENILWNIFSYLHELDTWHLTPSLNICNSPHLQQWITSDSLRAGQPKHLQAAKPILDWCGRCSCKASFPCNFVEKLHEQLKWKHFKKHE